MSETGSDAFDPRVLTEAVSQMDMSRILGAGGLSSLDPIVTAKVQDVHMTALIAAQRTAAAGFQDAFEAQVGLLARLFDEIEDNLLDLVDEDEANRSIGRGYERAVAEFQVLAEAAAKANMEAFGQVRDVIVTNVDRLKAGQDVG